MSLSWGISSENGATLPGVDLGLDTELTGVVGSVEVVERWGAPTSYAIRATVRERDGTLVPLDDEALDPGKQLAVVVSVDGESQCLVRGPIRGHQASLGRGLQRSSMQILGSDSSIELDREEKIAVLEGSELAIVGQILDTWYDGVDYGATSAFGTDVYDSPQFEESRRSFVQRGSDLSVVRRMARRYGRVFFERVDAQTLSRTAHYHRPLVDSTDPVQLVFSGRDPKQNLVQLQVGFDVERPSSFPAQQVDTLTVEPWSTDPDAVLVEGFADDDLRTVHGAMRDTGGTTPVFRSTLTTSAEDETDLAARVAGATLDSEFFVWGRATTTAHRLGRIVRAHDTVEVVGAGQRHSGLYYVRGVRHMIDASGYAMEIELARNALGARSGGLL